jgi:superfamily II DNA or RNA helicase
VYGSKPNGDERAGRGLRQIERFVNDAESLQMAIVHEELSENEADRWWRYMAGSVSHDLHGMDLSSAGCV